MSETLARAVERASGPRRLRQSLLVLGMTAGVIKKHKRSTDGVSRKGYVAI